MLIEFWESLCGYDKWTPAVATVESSNFADEKVRFGYKARAARSPEQLPMSETTLSRVTCVITWNDQSGKLYRGQYSVTPPSPIFGMYGGEKLPIRYNPANPQNFYLRELRKNEMYWMFKKVLYGLGLIAAGVYWYFRYTK